jgi:hypothetical protein
MIFSIFPALLDPDRVTTSRIELIESRFARNLTTAVTGAVRYTG